MDNESYNICLDLVEWFESVCQTVPKFELSRNCFYLNGKVVRIPSPGILRVTLREQASCLTLLSDLRRWLQICIEYSYSSDNIELISSLTYVSELLEREIEKDKYRSFFHGATNCSLKTNWYSGSTPHVSSSSGLSSKQSLKRSHSIKTTVSGGESSSSSKKLITTVSNSFTRKNPLRRGVVTSDSDDDDDEFKDKTTHETDSKKRVESKASIRVKTSSTIDEPVYESSEVAELSPAAAAAPVPVPASAPPKPRQTATVDPVIKETVLSIIQPLIDTPTFDLFVDPVPRSVTDYYEFIDSPLCLRDMIRKVNGGKYKKVNSIQKDIQLIIVNCIYYNMLNDPLQANNRKMAYLLFDQFLSSFYEHEPKLKEQGSIEEHQLLFKCYTNIIEALYGITENGYQLIRYFAVDPKKLHDYDRFVKKPIVLRAILNRLISLEYVSFDRIRQDFVLLFDNCIHYWRSYNYSAGRSYVEAAQFLKDQLDDILKNVQAEMDPKAEELMKRMNDIRIKRRKELQEKKKGEIRPSLMSPMNIEEFQQEPVEYSIPAPTVFTRTSNRVHNFEDVQFTPTWSSYAHRCLDLLKERVFPFWCWSLFLTPRDQLLKQPEYEHEIRNPITWMDIENSIQKTDRATFCGSMRLLFDNCLAYNQPRNITTTPAINWIRDPCKFLYNEFNLLWKNFSINPTPQDYSNLLTSLKTVRLDGFVPYFDFAENPKNYYSDYFTITDQPLGFNDTLHYRGTFDEWCDMIRKIFKDAMKYHSNNRGNPFISAEAEFLLSEFERICVVAKEVVNRGGSANEIECAPLPPSTEGCRVYSVDSSRMTPEQSRKCRSIVNEFRRIGDQFKLFENYTRSPNKNTINYLKQVERLVYINDISRLLDGNEYHNLEEFKNDFSDMINNLVYYYQGTEKKEVIILFSDFLKSVFGDLYRYSRVDPTTKIDDFFISNRSLLSESYNDDTIRSFFKSFNQDFENNYNILNASTFRSVINETPVDSEVVIAGDDRSLALDRVLPIVSDIENNPTRDCGRNYWEFLNSLLRVLRERLQVAGEIGNEKVQNVLNRAIQKAKEIFAGKVKGAVLSQKVNTYKNKVKSTVTQLEKQRIAHRPAGNQVSYLNSNEMRVYDTPSLYMLKVAKKAVLRELRPEIIEKEKEKEKKDRTPAPSVKLKLFGKDVETDNSSSVATIMANEEDLKEEVEPVGQEEETYSIAESFDI